MAVATFDTQKFANTLKAAGVPDKQAEAQAVAFTEVIQLNLKDLVTKDEFARQVEIILKEIVRQSEIVQGNIRETEQKLRAEMTSLRGEQVLIRWMFGIVATGFVGILVRLIFFRGPY
jgi:G3E family GTPase